MRVSYPAPEARPRGLQMTPLWNAEERTCRSTRVWRSVSWARCWTFLARSWWAPGPRRRRDPAIQLLTKKDGSPGQSGRWQWRALMGPLALPQCPAKVGHPVVRWNSVPNERTL